MTRAKTAASLSLGAQRGHEPADEREQEHQSVGQRGAHQGSGVEGRLLKSLNLSCRSAPAAAVAE